MTATRGLWTAAIPAMAAACTAWLAGSVIGQDNTTPANGGADQPGEVVTVPDVQTVFPQRRRPRVIAPQWQPVEVRSVDADVVITGETARTTLAVTLFNPSPRMARCELAVPVPADAAISAFRLDGLEGDPPATLLPRDEAREAFEAIVRKMIDPGLLEFAGSGLIKSSVFPVPANGEQTFRVTYEHPVRGDGDEIEYTLPRSGAMGAGPDWTVDVRIESKSPVVSVFSPSHEAGFEIDDEGVASLEETALAQPGAFRFVALRKPSAAGGAPAMSLFTYPDPESVDAGFFMLVLAAGERDADAPTLPREVTVVLDRSGSMQGEKFEQARSAALQVIRALGPEERFRVIDYSSEVATSGPAVDVTPEAIKNAVARLDALTAVGGTNINEALMTAIRPGPAEGVLPIVLFLTDGLPTVGVTDEKSIRDNILEANGGTRRLFTFGVGHDVNVPLLTDLARESRAIADFVDPGEDVEAAVGRVFDRLRGPVLAGVGLEADTETGGSPISEQFPRQLGDLFEQQRLVVLGRYRVTDGGYDLRVAGTRGDGDWSSTVFLDPAAASPENSHIARLWAQQKVTWLIDELRSAGADPRVQALDSLRDDPRLKELIDEVIALSTRYGILTEYTSFLAAEEKMRLSLDHAASLWEREIAPEALDERSGAGAVRLGRAQRMRRDSVTAARPAAPQEAARGGVAIVSGGGGQSPFQDQGTVIVRELGQAATTMQQVGPDTLYRQDARWVDAQLIRQDQSLDDDAERPEPDETVAFGSARYFEIASRLAEQSRQGLMAVPGEVEIWLDGRRILVQNPS